MHNNAALEINAFVPARDFELSQAFYQDLGFKVRAVEDGIAYVEYQRCSFLLQDYFIKEHANNCVMHLLVQSADDWWQKMQQKDISRRYRVAISKPEDRPWNFRDFVVYDPSGVLWLIGNNL